MAGVTNYNVALPRTGGNRQNLILDYHDAMVEDTQEFDFGDVVVKIIPNTGNDSYYILDVTCSSGWLTTNNYLAYDFRIQGTETYTDFHLVLCEMFSISTGSELTVSRIVDDEFMFGLDFNGDGNCDGGGVQYVYNDVVSSTSDYVECTIDECCVWHYRRTTPEQPSNPALRTEITHPEETSKLSLQVWFWGADNEIDFDGEYFETVPQDNYATALCKGTIPFDSRVIGSLVGQPGITPTQVYHTIVLWTIAGVDDYNGDVVLRASVLPNTMLYPVAYRYDFGDKTLWSSIPSVYSDVRVDNYLIVFPYGGGTRTFKIYDAERTYASKPLDNGYTLTYDGVEDNVHSFTLTSDGSYTEMSYDLNIGNGFDMYMLCYTMPTDEIRPLSGQPYLAGDDETTISIQYEVDGDFDTITDERLDNPLGWEIINRTFSSGEDTTICTTTLKATSDFGIRPYFNCFTTQSKSGNNFYYWIVKDGASITSDDTTIPYYSDGDYVYVDYKRYVPAGFSNTPNMSVEIWYTNESFDSTRIGYRITNTTKEYSELEKFYLNLYTENGYTKQLELVREAPVCRLKIIPSILEYNSLIEEVSDVKTYGYNMKTITTPVITGAWKNLRITDIGQTSEDKYYNSIEKAWDKDKTFKLNNGLSFTQDATAYLTVQGEGYDGKQYTLTETVTLVGAEDLGSGSELVIPMGYWVRQGDSRFTSYHIDDSSLVSITASTIPNRYDIRPLAVGETDLYWYAAPEYDWREGTYSKTHLKVIDAAPAYEGPSGIELAVDETKDFNIVLRNVSNAIIDMSESYASVVSREPVGNDLYMTIRANYYRGFDYDIEIETNLWDSDGNNLTFTIPVDTIRYPSRITPETTEIDVPAGYIAGSISVEYYDCEPLEATCPSWVVLTQGTVTTSGATRTVRYGYEIDSNGSDERTGEMTFSATGNDGNTLSSTVTITQQADTSKMASIALYTTTIDFLGKGGNKSVRVDYTNAQTINTPSSDSWVTISETSRETVMSGSNTITQVQYKITVATTSAARSANITFSCVGLDGVEVSSSRTVVSQAAPTAEITALQTYTNFRSNGGSDYVDFVVTDPDSNGLVLYTDSQYITELTVNNSETSGEYTTYQVYIEGEFTYTGSTKLTQYVKVSYTTEGGDGAELLYPIYIYPSDWGNIQPYNQVLNLNADGTPEISSYTSLGCGYSSMSVIDTPEADVDWFSITSYTVDTGASTYDEVRRWAYTAAPNDGAERRGNVSYTGTDVNGNTITAMSVIVQAAAEDYEEPSDPDTPDLPSNSYDTTIAPIWMDTEYVWGSQESTVFTISVEVPYFIPHLGVQYLEEIIYKGKAWRKPDDDRIKVMVNKICQNYFVDSYLPLNTAVAVEGGYRKFLLRTEGGLLLHTYYFVNDWSYKTLRLGLKTDPIIPNIVEGQRLFFSAFAHDEQLGYEWGMSYSDGTPDYNNLEYVKNNIRTVIVPPARTRGVKTFRYGNKSYSAIPACSARYVLYYLNPYGGWDWFPVMGSVKRVDNLTPYSYTRNYNNTTLDFGKTRYLSEINIKYTMNTGWLSQAQADRMWELQESNSVYMHDLKTDEIRPMVITDTQVEHKQKNRSQKIIQYTINIEESQTRERM